ncbi:MFS transporter [Stenotrophomonas maltophilia]|uniref:MFS transporter n=1 Tax=Stenotrophomonas maltophilia TaxID=40324 RepID=A0A246IDC1_STEMA|nr:MFS transporter [Stenotrophomonas maltophilia]OWQ78018.1 MFS transporter [Stenotrophomonas maltophilia]
MNRQPPVSRELAPATPGLVLGVLATAQLTLVLDDSIANIALPLIQRDLGLSPSNLSWIINAYILAFGGLLLFGGRLGDVYGKRRVLRIGMALFALASLLAGLANDGVWLILARAGQGIGAALTAPSVLALIAANFSEGPPRNKALAVYGAMSGLGIVAGLIVGGVLTAAFGWRSVFFINVPIALAVWALSAHFTEPASCTGRLEVPSALLSMVAMVSLILAITRAGSSGLADPLGVGAMVLFAASALAFVMQQKRSAAPLVPLRLFTNRHRAGAYGAAVLLAFGPMGMLYVMTLYMQDVLGYGPLRTALHWLPFGAGILGGAAISSALATRFASHKLATTGASIGASGMASLAFINQDSSYALHLAPAMFVLAAGFVIAILALTQTAVIGVKGEDLGIASALLNSSQQIGVALGVAVVSAVAIARTTALLGQTGAVGLSKGDSGLASAIPEVLSGYRAGLSVGAVAVAFSAAVAWIVSRPRPRRRKNSSVETRK